MNAHTLLSQITQKPSPARRHAGQVYAAMLPACADTARIPSPLAYAAEADDIISRHALAVALQVAAIAADRAKRPDVRKLVLAVIEGDDWSTRYARSCNDDDLAMVEDAGATLRDAAEDIAAKDWGV